MFNPQFIVYLDSDHSNIYYRVTTRCGKDVGHYAWIWEFPTGDFHGIAFRQYEPKFNQIMMEYPK